MWVKLTGKIFISDYVDIKVDLHPVPHANPEVNPDLIVGRLKDKP